MKYNLLSRKDTMKHRIGMALLSLFMLGFCGCELLDLAKENHKKELEEEAKDKNKFPFLQKGAEQTADKKDPSEEVPMKSDVQTGVTDQTLKTLEQRNRKDAPAVPKVSGKQAPFYEDFIVFDADDSVAVSLVFNSAPLLDVIPAFADVLGFNFLGDPDLKGTVTLNINSNMTKRELWQTFDRMISMSGAAVRVDNSMLRITPVSKLAQQPDLSVESLLGREVCYYPLKNTTAKDVVTQVKPFLSKDAAISELTRPNAILVSDTADNVRKLNQILDLIDRNGKNAWPRLVMRCDNILPSKIVDELKTVFPVLGFYVQQTTDRTEQPGSVQLTAIDRLQLIIGSAATEEAVEEIREWVRILDSSQSLDQERVFVYKVQHGKADRLLKGLSNIYNTTGQSLTVDSDTGNERSENVTTQNNSNTRRATTSSSSNSRTSTNIANNATNTETDQSSSLFETPVRIFADGELNRLVIRTTPRTYASIKALLDRLDIVPAQVLLQVLVVEVTLDKSTEFGLELSAAGSINGNKFAIGNNYSNMNPFTTALNADGSTTTAINPEQGGTALFYDPNNMNQKFGYIKALAKNGNLKVVSSPQVLVSSYKEAEIWVGRKVPYVSSAITDTASTSASSTTYNASVSFEEIGIRLTITPEITSTSFIALDVKQELSDIDDTTTYSNATSAPVFSYRTVETNMTIQNGKTMVIGGLIKETKKDSLESLPIIDSIPFLRRLFGSTDASAQRSEILLLITGTIVNEKSEVEDMIRKYNDAVKTLRRFDEHLGDGEKAGEKFRIFEKEELF